MKYYVDRSGDISAYMQLYLQLRKDITDGVLAYGTKLPSKRLLAEETQVSVITAQHTYDLLCDEGYVESRQRSGYFVIYRKGDLISSNKELPCSTSINHAHLHSTSGNFPFSVLSKAMRKVLNEYQEDILLKSPNRGCLPLRQAISAYLARSNGIQARPDQIIIGSGAEYLYSLLVQLLGNDRVFALEQPSYNKIRQVYEANGVVCDPLTLGADGIIRSELARTNATVLHVTPFNSFPSGVTASASKRYEYLLWAKQKNGYIIEDNYDSELTVSTKHEDTVFSLGNNDCVIYLNTFSKTIAPSIRVGYMVLPAGLIEVFEQKLGFYSCTVPVFEQYLLAELLNSGDFERHVNRVRRARRRLQSSGHIKNS